MLFSVSELRVRAYVALNSGLKTPISQKKSLKEIFVKYAGECHRAKSRQKEKL